MAIKTDVKNTVLEGDRHLVSLRFATVADGAYTVVLQACSDWRNAENGNTDSFLQISDLGLLKIKTILPDGSNLAADYTSEDGTVTWTQNAGIHFKNDKTRSLYGGYAWGFGIPETSVSAPAYVTVRATGLDANANYNFSYYYSEDYVIYLDSVKKADGTPVTDRTTPLVSAVTDYATARKVSFDFKTATDGDYIITLKMAKGWNSTPNNWGQTVLSDLSLVKQAREKSYENLAAFYTNAAGNLNWNQYICTVKYTEATGIAGYSGYSYSFGLDSSENANDIPTVEASDKKAEITVHLGFLEANTSYDFSFKYGKDYLIKLLPQNSLKGPNGRTVSYSTPVDTVLQKGDRMHKVSTTFTTGEAGEYTLVLTTCKGAGYRNRDLAWDAVTFGDVTLTYHPENTVTGKVVADVGGTVTVNSEDGVFAKGGTVTATAAAALGNSFVGWYNQNGTQVSTQNPYTFKAAESFELTAKFTGENLNDWNLFSANNMDGTFEESSVPGWYAVDFWEGNDTSWCAFERVQNMAYEGNWSLRIKANHQAVYLPFKDLKPNTEYQLSFYINCPADDSQTKIQQFSLLMDSVTAYTSGLDWIKGGTGWHKVSCSFNSGNAENIIMLLHMQGYNGNDLMYLDNLSLVQCVPQEITNSNWNGAALAENGYTLANTGSMLHQVFKVEEQSSYTVSFKAKGNIFAGAGEVGIYAQDENSLLSSQSKVNTDSDTFESYSFSFFTSGRKAVKLFFKALNAAAEVKNIKITKNGNRSGSVIEKIDFETGRFALRHADSTVFSLYTASGTNDEKVHSGSKSLYFNAAAAASDKAYLFDEAYLSAQLKIGMSYRLRIFYKLENGAQGGKILLAPEYRGNGAEGIGIEHGATDNGWNELVFTFTNKSFTALKTAIGTVLNSTNGSFYVDDIELTVVRPLVVNRNPDGKYAALVYNYIENGNFENAMKTAEWGTLPAGISVKTGDAAAGEKYLHAEKNGFYVVPVKVKAGEEYIFAASVRGGANSYIGISATADGTTFYSTAEDTPASYLSAGSESWQRKAFCFSSEENGLFYLVLKGAAGGLDVDNIMLYQSRYGLAEDPNDYAVYLPYDYEATTGSNVILNGGLGLQPATGSATGNGEALEDSSFSTETALPNTGDTGLPLAVILLGLAALAVCTVSFTGKQRSRGK